MIANQPNGQYRTQCCGVHYVRFQVTRLARLMTTCGRKAAVKDHKKFVMLAAQGLCCYIPANRTS